MVVLPGHWMAAMSGRWVLEKPGLCTGDLLLYYINDRVIIASEKVCKLVISILYSFFSSARDHASIRVLTELI